MARLQAIEAYRATMGDLPLCDRVLYEDDEARDLASLAAVCDPVGILLTAAGCIWGAGYTDAAGRPTISCALKGIAYVQIRVRAASKDAPSSLATFFFLMVWRLPRSTLFPYTTLFR